VAWALFVCVLRHSYPAGSSTVPEALPQLPEQVGRVALAPVEETRSMVKNKSTKISSCHMQTPKVTR
jgi:hypothetical protein